MKCERCQPLIEDYFDGELEQQIGSQVSAHVQSCNACSALAAEIKFEREIYTRYHRDVDVTADLWASVQARIQAEQGMLQNENTKLQVLYAAADAEERAWKQRVSEQAIADIGSMRRLPPLGL